MRKSLDMDQEGFQHILREFAPDFHSLRSLAESLHRVILPMRAGVLWTGTDNSPEDIDKLYDGVIYVF